MVVPVAVLYPDGVAFLKSGSGLGHRAQPSWCGTG
jgi:hypothetical protein